uniref:ARAD1C11594p n=1 Tax=Blastobotrys adeninivorans TaxID=409370 RepID=A0A060T5E8_BLAAD
MDSGVEGPLTLDTTTHTLTYFPSNRYGDPPYYHLVSKRRPYLSTPLPLTADDTLDLEPGNDDPQNLTVHLKNCDIGIYRTEKDEQRTKELAQFAATWRSGMANLGSGGSETSLGADMSSHAVIADVLNQNYNDLMSAASISLRAMTWNLMGQSISSLKLSSLLGLPVMSDIYVLAIQEFDTLGAKTLYSNPAGLQELINAVLMALSESGEYFVVDTNQLLGIKLVIFAHSRLRGQISSTKKATTGTGLFGVWGNKGAAALWLTIGEDPMIPGSGTEMVVANCHLSAGDTKDFVVRRRWELSEISKKFHLSGLAPASEKVIFDSDAQVLDDFKLEEDGFDSETLKDDDSEEEQEVQSASSVSDSKSSKSNPIVILLGDLNYRVTLDKDMVQDYSERGNYRTILVSDQLRQDIIDSRILSEFVEGVISFAPTYKYQIGTNKYDMEVRTPSYTDRIFYSKNDSRISQLDYSSIADYVISDHRPVVSRFELSIPMMDAEKRKALVDSTLKDMDKRENSGRPSVVVDPKEAVKEDCVIFCEGETFVSITNDPNSAQRLLEWQVILPPTEQVPSTKTPSLRVEPTKGLLPAGGSQQIRIAFTPQLSIRDEVSVLIIRVKDGQDVFVPIEFHTLPTAIGASLDLLSRMPDGARSKKIMETSSTNMPREIWSCVDYLWTRIVPDMFLKKGDPTLQALVQEWMDKGEYFDAQVLDAANEAQESIAVYSVAQQFMILLQSLPMGIVPPECHALLMKEDTDILLEALPSVNANVLLYITGFLQRAIQQGVDESQLLDKFEPLLIATPRGKDSGKSKMKRKKFLKTLIS